MMRFKFILSVLLITTHSNLMADSLNPFNLVNLLNPSNFGSKEIDKDPTIIRGSLVVDDITKMNIQDAEISLETQKKAIRVAKISPNNEFQFVGNFLPGIYTLRLRKTMYVCSSEIKIPLLNKADIIIRCPLVEEKN